MSLNVNVVKTEAELQDAFRIRVKVFVDEQKVPPEEEIDQYEDVSTHFVVYDGKKVVGAGRLRELDGYGKVERICIDADYRNKGVGKLLMEAIEAEGKQNGLHQFKLNAQIQAEPFYKKLGYETCSGEFLDAGIPHVTMKK